MTEKSLQFSALGLSCVENYTLSILEKHLTDTSYLFCMSYLSGGYLLNKIVSEGVSLNKFSLFPRVHEVAFEHLSIVYLFSYEEAEIADMWNKMKLERDNIYYLIKVNPSFVTEALKADLARDDHYICYWFKNGKNNVFNDYPYRLTQFSEDEISEAYDGNIIVFEIINNISDSIKGKAHRLFCEHIKQYVHSKTADIDIECITLAQAKEFLIIYKRILQRMLLFCAVWLEENNSISSAIKIVDNILTKMYMNEKRRRESHIFDFINEFSKILLFDKSIFDYVRKVSEKNFSV
jgi:hypothetical protein